MIATLTAGLLLGEIVLMFLGVVLFVALLVLLIIKVARNQNASSLLLFFILPILMIGYPTIQSFKVKDFLEVTKNATEAVERNPSDTITYKALVDLLKELKYDRIKNDPENLALVGEAQSALGNYDDAIKATDDALALEPNNEKAKKVKERAQDYLKDTQEFKKKIDELDKLVSSEPDAARTNRVAEVLADVKPPRYIDQRSSIVIAKSLAAVNKQEKALETLSNVAVEAGNETEVNRVKNEILTESSTTTISPDAERKLNSSEVMKADMKRKMVVRAQ